MARLALVRLGAPFTIAEARNPSRKALKQKGADKHAAAYEPQPVPRIFSTGMRDTEIGPWSVGRAGSTCAFGPLEKE